MTHDLGQWSITLFRYVGTSQKVKLLTKIYVKYQLLSEYNCKYVFVKIERNKMSKFSKFKKRVFFVSKNTVTINFEYCDLFSRAVKHVLVF